MGSRIIQCWCRTNTATRAARKTSGAETPISSRSHLTRRARTSPATRVQTGFQAGQFSPSPEGAKSRLGRAARLMEALSSRLPSAHGSPAPTCCPSVPRMATRVRHQMHGIWECALSGLDVQMEYGDNDSGTGNIWTGSANWLAVAWTPGLATEAVAGGEFLVIKLTAGNRIAFGAGTLAAGAALGIPAGFTAANLLTIATPASFQSSGAHIACGVYACAIEDGVYSHLLYTDQDENLWYGNVNWFAFCWE